MYVDSNVKHDQYLTTKDFNDKKINEIPTFGTTQTRSNSKSALLFDLVKNK